ncbi:MAG: DUF4292 domain-containing protein [Crocinitomicaceae bacterium]|nr:DUF4292 domain-containing protein [Crocinitomicaceae bacterium]
MEKLRKVKDDVLIETLDSLSAQKFDYFYAKIGTKYQDSIQRISFKTSLRIVEDSAFNALITYARIPMFNALVTFDSIRISNKREKCYIEQSLDYFKNILSVDFTYDNMEEILLGLPLDYDSTVKYFRVKDPFTYRISSHKKNEIKHTERLDKEEVILFYEFSDDHKELKETRIENPTDTTSVRINYISRQEVNGLKVPAEMEITIVTPRQEILIEMNYGKVRVKEKEEIYFVIPESYEVCE